MKMKNIENQCTTLEQSKRLWEMGFSRDTASARIVSITGDKWIVLTDDFDYYKEDFPCWTVGDMMKIIHTYRGFSINILGQVEIFSLYEPSAEIIGKKVTIRDDYSLLRDNLFDCLVWLKDNKYL